MTSFYSRIKVLIWMCTRGQLIHFQYKKTRQERSSIKNILTSTQTIEYILSHNCSVTRFGDGEFQMIEHGWEGGDAADFGVDTFQSFDASLAKRLGEVLLTPQDNLLVCIPYPMIHSDVYRGYERIYFEREWLGRPGPVKKAVRKHQELGDAAFTRFYMHRQDITDYPAYVNAMKRIWNGASVILIEGEKSRLGVGNDLFDNVADLHRIICPAVNAYSAYHRIISAIEQLGRKDTLYLLALGHTATVLAADLAKKGYRAIDLGHVDIEYEWMRMKAKKKCPIKDKYVNEVPEGRVVSDKLADWKYEKEILIRIG